MNKLTDDLNIIQNLPDQPTLSAQELKAKFDEAVGIIKEYLNTVVEPAVTEIQGNYTTSEELTEYKEGVQTTLDGFQEAINGIDDMINNATKDILNYGDFVVETESIAYSVGQSEGQALTGTYSKTGHKPLGLVGNYYSNLYGATANGAYASAISDTEITVKGYVARGNTGGTTAGSLYVNILWLKTTK